MEENKKEQENTEATEPENNKEIIILIKTSMGNMKARLYNKTPQHRDNFVKLVKDGWYEGSIFHRVINNFMIQGGHQAKGVLDVDYTVPAEFVHEYFHKKGALAAARTGDHVNPQKASSGNQFYIVHGNSVSDATLNMIEERTGMKYTPEQREAYIKLGGTPHLDFGYTVFGEVFEGLQVIDKIAAVETGQGDYPKDKVTMYIEIIEE
ncbi:MAG: peptidylprolyl isomerase [Bacteroidales bacterium]|nr:peptidylprolyl isomerase [Bacteroidales bacterium]